MKRLALLAAVSAGACSWGGRGDNPEVAVETLIAAARTGDRGGVYRTLGPSTRARIEGLVTASRKISGRVSMKPEDFLSVGWAPPAWEPAGMRILRQDELSAEVEAYSDAGDRHTVTLVREGGRWKVELPGR